MRFAKEQIKKGLMDKGLKYGISQLGGPILDPRKVIQMLVETMLPETFALLDVCRDCGCVYAVRLERQEVPLGEEGSSEAICGVWREKSPSWAVLLQLGLLIREQIGLSILIARTQVLTKPQKN